MYHMKQQAIRDCDATAKAYADCASGRVFSVVWACRKQFGDLNNCLKTRCGSSFPDVWLSGMQMRSVKEV